MLLAGFAVLLFIGVAKAGFGGGLGMLVTPLCVLAFGPKTAIGILLPLLCAGDLFSLSLLETLAGGELEISAARRSGRRRHPGATHRPVFAAPAQHRHRTDRRAVRGFQLAKERIFRAEGAFVPQSLGRRPCGIGMGITSTFGPRRGAVAAMFLMPQRLPKEIFVGTSVLVFTFVNWIKLPFSAWTGHR